MHPSSPILRSSRTRPPRGMLASVLRLRGLAPVLRLRGLAPALTTVSMLATSAAWGEDASAENKAAAREFATQGIQLAQAGNCEEAVPKLERADKLYHAPTILTWIGQCQIELGRYVEGTETLNRVVREQIGPSAPDAYKTAQGKARELIEKARPKIGRLTIAVAPEGIEELQVTVDERQISSALVGAPKPTDPGTHTVTVSAPGYQTATQEVELDAGARETLSFELEADPNATPTETTTATTPSNSTDLTQEARSIPTWVGWTAIGVGGALMVGGGVTGYLAMSKESDLECESDGSCPSSQDDTLTAAKTNATISTVLFGAGGAAAVTGVVLLIAGGSKSKKTAQTHHVQPLVGLGSVGLTGRF